MSLVLQQLEEWWLYCCREWWTEEERWTKLQFVPLVRIIFLFESKNQIQVRFMSKGVFTSHHTTSIPIYKCADLRPSHWQPFSAWKLHLFLCRHLRSPFFFFFKHGMYFTENKLPENKAKTLGSLKELHKIKYFSGPSLHDYFTDFTEFWSPLIPLCLHYFIWLFSPLPLTISLSFCLLPWCTAKLLFRLPMHTNGHVRIFHSHHVLSVWIRNYRHT